jgi:hypothetical protein
MYLTNFDSLTTNTQKVTYIFKNFQFALCLAGIVGNFYTFLVLSRQRFATFTFPFYAKLMAITDSLVLIIAINNWTSFMLKLDLMQLPSPVLFKIASYLEVTSSGISLWLLVSISFDRFLTITRYNTTTASQIIKTLKFRLTLIGIVLIWNSLIHLPMPLNISLTNMNCSEASNASNYNCQPQQSMTSPKLINWLIFGNIFAASGVINNVLTVMLFVSLARTRRVLMGRNNGMEEVREQRDRKFAVTSIGLNVACLCFKMPLTIFGVVYSYVSVSSDVAQMVFTICEVIFTLDNAAAFFINMLGNSFFMSEFWEMMIPNVNRPYFENINLYHIRRYRGDSART